MDTERIVVLDGPTLASSDRFILRVQGKGGHATNPDKCVDPIWIGSQIVANLQAVVARNTDAHEALILSVTKFQAGSAFNVIPDSAELSGSVRCYSPEMRARMPEAIERIARSAAKHICHPHYHPLFDFDEDALEHGVRMFTAAPFTLNALEN